MKRRILIAAATLLSILSFDPTSRSAAAQDAKDIVGTWAHVANVNTAADGTKSDTFGPNPKGQAIFGDDGRFSYIFHRADLPKFAANNRAQGTPEENKAVVAGLTAAYGTYTLADKEIIFKIEGSSFPNWVGTEQRRPIIALTADELKYTIPVQSAGGRSEVTLRRMK